MNWPHARKGRIVLFLITFNGFCGLQVVYSLAGDVKAIYIARLEQIILRSQKSGMRVCFDMDKVHSLDAGVLRFFTEGAGRDCVVIAPPKQLQLMRGQGVDQEPH